MIIFEVFLFSFLGIFFGVITGLLPGISMTVVMIALFFVLSKFDPLLICCFYISCLVVSQYMGSVSATLLGICGETSSVPALKEGYKMNSDGRGREALLISSAGSFVGSFIAISIVLITWPLLDKMFYLNYTEIKLFFIFLIFSVLIVTSKNNKFLTLLLISIGYFLGKIGLDKNTNESWGTFGFDFLFLGVPKILMLICFYAIPLILYTDFSTKKKQCKSKKQINLSNAWNILPKLGILRGAVIGFFVGLIPFMTYEVSSNSAWAVEKKIAKSKYKLGHAPSLAAAETANNAGALSSLLPFLIFLVPIQLSEIVLLDIINFNSRSFNPGWLFDNNNFLYLLIGFFLANLLGFIASWTLANKSIEFIDRYKSHVKVISVCLMLLSIIFSSYSLQEFFYNFVLGTILFIIGYSLRKLDVVPLLTAFLLSNVISSMFDILLQKIF